MELRLISLTSSSCDALNLSRFNPVSVGAGITVCSNVMFMLRFHSGGYTGYYTGSLSELCHKCVTYIHKG